jgi:hypothetical protein
MGAVCERFYVLKSGSCSKNFHGVELNSRTPKQTSSFAILSPPQLVSLKHQAVLAKLPAPALRTKNSIHLKVSIDVTINFWFTQLIAISASLPSVVIRK